MCWKGFCNLFWIIWVCVCSWFRDFFGWGVGFEEKWFLLYMEIIFVFYGIYGEFYFFFFNLILGLDDIVYYIDIYLLFRGYISNFLIGKV